MESDRMSNSGRTKFPVLVGIKLLHTVIWVFFVTIIFYVLYSGIVNEITRSTWIAIGIVFAEGLVLMLFKMFCPLTVLARNYSNSTKANFDIYLPTWLAEHNKLIFTSIFIIACGIVLVRKFMK